MDSINPTSHSVAGYQRPESTIWVAFIHRLNLSCSDTFPTEHRCWWEGGGGGGGGEHRGSGDTHEMCRSAHNREANEVEVEGQGKEETDKNESCDIGLEPLELLALEVGQHDDAREEARDKASSSGEPVGVAVDGGGQNEEGCGGDSQEDAEEGVADSLKVEQQVQDEQAQHAGGNP